MIGPLRAMLVGTLLLLGLQLCMPFAAFGAGHGGGTDDRDGSLPAIEFCDGKIEVEEEPCSVTPFVTEANEALCEPPEAPSPEGVLHVERCALLRASGLQPSAP